MVKNKEVKDAFFRREQLKGMHLASDGNSLWSYGWWEIARWVNRKVVIRKGKSYSRTTEIQHRRGVTGKLANKETPKDQAEMNI